MVIRAFVLAVRAPRQAREPPVKRQARVQLPPIARAGSRVLLLALLLIVASCAVPAAGRLVLVDETATLDRARVAAAAAPLVARGATVVVMLVEQGDQSGEDFARRLGAAGLLRDSQIVARGLAVYVSRAPRYSELRAGEPWSASMDDGALEQLRQEALNPSLRAGDFTAGVTAALVAFEGRLAARDQENSFIAWVWVGLGCALAGLAVFTVFGDRIGNWWYGTPLRRPIAWVWDRSPPGRRQARRRYAQDLAAARRDLQEAARRAHAQMARLEGRPAIFTAGLAALDQRHGELLQRTDGDAELPQQMRQLRSEFQRTEHELRAITASFALLKTAADDARNQLERVAAAFAAAEKPPSRRKRRSAQAVPQPASDAGKARLADLQARIAQLDEQRAALAQAVTGPVDLPRVEALQGAYEDLRAESRELWKTELPRAYAAYLRSQIARDPTGSAAAGDTYTSPGSASSSSSDSSSDWSSGSSDWSSSSSGDESRAGGDW